MLVNLKKILSGAQKGKYAVGAFNINNLEITHAIVDAALAEDSPVILQTSEGAVEYAGMMELASLAHIAAKKHYIPICFHLDHGANYDFVVEAVKSGLYTSVMYDGSHLPYSENVKNTKRIVQMAHKRGISVEAELGRIAGTEDKVSVKDREASFTDPDEATDFVKKTGCDALAVSVGTSHGAYKFSSDSKLDQKRLQAIAKKVRIPLVLHGASGVPANIKKLCMSYGCKIADAKGVSDASIKKAVQNGIRKVNIDTDLRIAFDAGVRKFLKENPEVIDPRKILGPAQELMTKVVRQKIRMLGSSGKA